MMGRISQKVAEIRREPEHIRMRYVMICLAVSMVFIAGVWMLTLRESLANARTDRGVAETLAPQSGEPSLSDLFENQAPLTVENEAPKTGQEYFNEQFEREPSPTPSSETQGGPGLSGEGVTGGAGTP